MDLPLSIRSESYYTTKELARLLRVNESTIRRWANSGKMKCFKSPGGHRKYTPEHISEFIKRYHYEILNSPFDFSRPASELATKPFVLKQDFQTLGKAFSMIALRADTQGLLDILQQSYGVGTPLVQIYDRIVGEAIRNLIVILMERKISDADIQIASHAMIESLYQFRLMTPAHSISGRIAVCGCLTNGVSEVTLISASHLLEITGWKVYNVGSHVLVNDFLDSIQRYSASLVCASSDQLMKEGERCQEAVALSELAREKGAHVIFSALESPDGYSLRENLAQTKLVLFSSFEEMLALVSHLCP